MNLKKFRQPLEESLRGYESLHKELTFQDFPDFILTPNKPNSARTVVPVSYGGTHVGDMHTFVFRYQDGTGDENTYKLDDIKVPLNLRHEKKPERIVPREKKGVIAEGFFPLFSLNNEERIIPFTSHLQEFTLDSDKNLISLFDIGQSKSLYLHLIDSGLRIKPEIYLSTGTYVSGKRFGDPHVIYHGLKDKNTTQVVGFFSVKERDNPMLEILNNSTIPIKYR